MHAMDLALKSRPQRT